MLKRFRVFNKSKYPAAIIVILQLAFSIYIPNTQTQSNSKPESAIVEFSGQLVSAQNLNRARDNRTIDYYKIIDICSTQSSFSLNIKIKAIIINNVLPALHINKFTPNKFSFRGPPLYLV